ncbi:MAG: type VI secretion system baseplate subunit TssK [Magnetospirillum sp.]|nr:type VI secretion system baseplate subunit TssK [Magnetospirillum sp.]
MVELNDIPEAVLWSEGMLLAPQHLQQASARAEALLGYMAGATGLFPWGCGVWPWTAPCWPPAGCGCRNWRPSCPTAWRCCTRARARRRWSLDLTKTKAELADAPMAVHLMVPVEAPLPEPGALKRLRSVEGRPVADANTGDGDVLVSRLRPVLSLALTPSPLLPPSTKFVSLPIARVAFKDDAFALEPFAPPRTTIPAGSELADLSRQVASRLRDKAAAMAERLRAPAAEALPGGTLLETLRSMVEPLPRLEALVEAEDVHPFHVYLSLCDLMGNLAWMGGQPVPPAPPRYHHADPLPAFQEVSEFLLRMIDRVRETYRSIRFTRLAPDRFGLDLTAAMLTGDTLVVGASIAPGATPSDTVEWLSKALIGSKSMLRVIGERRIRGAARERVDLVEELGLVPPATMVLFRVAADTEFVQPGQPLEVVDSGVGGVVPAQLQVFAAYAAEPLPAAGRR